VHTPYWLLVSDFHLANSFSNEVRRVYLLFTISSRLFRRKISVTPFARTAVRIEPFERGLAKIDEIN
jgi:hypothetical protein